MTVGGEGYQTKVQSGTLWIYFTFLGCKSEAINVGGQKVYSAELENALLSLPNVRDVTVRGERNPITGQIVVAHFNLVEPENPTLFKKRVREFCRERFEPYKAPARIEIVDRDQFTARFKKMRNWAEADRS